MDDHSQVLERALALAKVRKPQASIEKQASFAACVAYLVTGWFGGYGGPRVREHAASMLFGGARYSFEDAVDLLLSDEGPIFGPITEVHERCWTDQYCFDDDPADVTELVARTGYSH